jgi:predicted phage terminase large subunit-like protein
VTQQSAQRSEPILTPEDYAYSRLIAYAAYQWPGYRDAPHHRLIARKLEAVERGEVKRLMITMPPRHGKSMLASEFFPAWYLGRNPDHSVVTATYAQDLADDFGRKVKNQIEDYSFPEIFPGVGLADDSKSVKRFHIVENDVLLEGGFEHTLRQRGAFYAVGVGGPLTGRGAHLLLIDDPVKNREDADSEIIRKKTKDWYTSTAYTRLMPGGRVVIIQTRWHEEDLSGWLLAEHAHEGWEVLNLPAIDTNGNALWPDQYDVPALNRIKLAIGARDWSALYQQSPSPETGNFFKADWLRPYEKAPAHDTLRVYGGSDYAVTADGGDYTVHAVVGIDPEDRMYLLDLWRKQTASDVWIEAFCDLVKQWKPIGWAEEQGQIKSGVGPFLEKRQRERQAWCAREQFPTRGDKAVRAQSIRGRMAHAGLYVPVNAPWYPDLRSELLSFPAGKHDDQVDALGLVGQLLDKMTKGIAEKQPKGPIPAKDYRAYSDRETGSADPMTI